MNQAKSYFTYDLHYTLQSVSCFQSTDKQYNKFIMLLLWIGSLFAVSCIVWLPFLSLLEFTTLPRLDMGKLLVKMKLKRRRKSILMMDIQGKILKMKMSGKILRNGRNFKPPYQLATDSQVFQDAHQSLLRCTLQTI